MSTLDPGTTPFWLHVDSDGHRWAVTYSNTKSPQRDDDWLIACCFTPETTEQQVDFVLNALNGAVSAGFIWPEPRD